MFRGISLVCVILLPFFTRSLGQDSLPPAIYLPDKYLTAVDKKVQNLDEQLTKQTDAYLNALAKKEEKIRAKLLKLDSSKAAQVFGETKKTYDQLSQKFNAINGKTNAVFSGDYLPYLDSLQGTLGFLRNAKNIITKSKDIQQRLDKSLEQVKQLQNKLQKAEEIKAYVNQRQEQLKRLLANYTNLPRSVGKYFGKYQRQAYFYGQQIKEYKDALNDPDKLLKKVLATLQTIPTFKKFMSRYSMLAMLFPTADNYDPTQVVQGLSGRQQVMSFIQGQTGMSNTNNLSAVQQNVGSAQSQVNELRNRANQEGGSGDLAMPDFKPDDMRTKSILKNLEYGTSFQSQRATNFFPAMSDVGFTLGYKPMKKSVIGIAIVGKIGWGEGWKHIKVTYQGVGFRFFSDWKVPPIWGSKEGSLWLTAGAEMDYRKPVESLSVFKNYDLWTKSALVGITKKFKAGKKVNGSMAVLFDFLYQQHIPRTQPLVFRVGYTLN
ncbi:MAG: hypothetical protein KF746_11925 [Chitinophagaceae bacterium]|nr:hypothetical protein [Chitinophagaceae bacterium]